MEMCNNQLCVIRVEAEVVVHHFSIVLHNDIIKISVLFIILEEQYQIL